MNIILQNASSSLVSLLPFFLIMVVFYFFMIRPQIKKQRTEEKFRSELKKGDKVVTIGGIYGKILGIKEHKIILEINDNTKMTVERSSVSSEKSKQNNL